MKAQIVLNEEVRDKIVELVRVYAQLQNLKTCYRQVRERCPYELHSDEGQRWLNEKWQAYEKAIKDESRRLRDLYELFDIDYNGELLPLPSEFATTLKY